MFSFRSIVRTGVVAGALAIALPAAAGTLAPQLQALRSAYNKAPKVAVAQAVQATNARTQRFFSPRVNAAGEVQVYIHYRQDQLPGSAALAAIGASDVLVSRPLGVVQAWVPIAKLEHAAALSGVARVSLPVYGHARSTSGMRPAADTCNPVSKGLAIDNEGIAAENVGPVQKKGVTGDGVKVGIISNGAECVSSSQSAGYLPSDVDVITTGSGDEGTAMLEEVHAMAPDATLGFCSGLTTAAFLSCLDDFADWGAKVISDDIGFAPIFYNEPVFYDRTTGGNAITEFAAAHPDISLTAAAGNDRQDYFEGDYVGTTSPSSPFPITPTLSPPVATTGGPLAPIEAIHKRTYTSAMNFGAMANKPKDAAEAVVIGPGVTLVADLTWNDPAKGPYDDLDLFLLKQDGSLACQPTSNQWCSSTIDQVKFAGPPSNPNAAPPGEYLIYTNNTSKSQQFYLEALCYDCSAHAKQPLHVKLYGTMNSGGIFEYTSDGSIAGHAALAAELTVVAACYDPSGADALVPECNTAGSTRSTIEPFSGTGPYTFGDWVAGSQQRAKPDITGIDGITVSGAGGFASPFYGTSAASPNVGAVLALLRSFAPNAEPDAAHWKQFLMSNANPKVLDNYVTDPNTGSGTIKPFSKDAGGAGLVDAAAALDSLGVPITAKITAPTGSPAKVAPATPVQFKGECDYSGTDTLTYKWSFGKSGSGAPPDATGLTPAPVEYADGGIYTATFTCVAQSGSGSATETIAVQAAATSKDASFKTGHNQKLNGQLAGSGLGGEAISFVLVKGPAHGKVNVADDGKFSYTPEQGFAGDDSFQFAIKNGVKESNTATVTIDVAAGKPPVAKDGTLTTKENQEATGTLSATDPDGDSLTFRIVTQPQHGKVSLDNPNTGAYTYTPAHNYSGADSFVFVANDGTADSNKATVKVTVKKNSGGGGGGAFGGLGLGLLAGLGGLIFLIRRKR